jgi:hypothetical protein
MSGGFGISAIIMAGKGRSVTPVSATLLSIVEQIEVLQVADGQSGFRLVFGATPAGGLSSDFSVLAGGRFDPFNRVVIMVSQGAIPTVLMDGIVTDQWLNPDDQSGGQVVVSGSDVSVMMDLEETATAHPGQNESTIAAKLIARYASYGLVPDVKRPSGQQTPTPNQRIPMQRGSDLDYLYTMAGRFGFVFRVSPGPLPLMSTGYWGPAVTTGTQRRALTLAYGGLGNIEQMVFTESGLAAERVKGSIQDPQTNKPRSVEIRNPTLPALARRTPYGTIGGKMRQRLLNRADGLVYAQAQALAQGRVNQSTMRIVTAEGEVDALAYGDILRPAAPVGVRGAGASFDGLYAVDQVTHILAPGSYRQRFRLRRDGTGSRQTLLRP